MVTDKRLSPTGNLLVVHFILSSSIDRTAQSVVPTKIFAEEGREP